MEAVRDLLLGRPRAGLAPTLLLAGEVTVPYGKEPSPEAVEAVWRERAGDRELPAWILLGPRDTPSGTVWRLAWCPSAGTGSTSPGEVLLPEAVWILERLSSTPGRPGWHGRILSGAPGRSWAALFEGERCDRLVGPFATPELARRRIDEHARRAELALDGEATATWMEPTTADLRRLAEFRPESDLLPAPESRRRSETRADFAALARVGAIVGVFGTVSLGLAGWQLVQARIRHAEEVRLESVRPLLDRISVLRETRERAIGSLESRKDAALPNSSADRLLAGLARRIPSGTTLQALQLESAGPEWRTRLEAHAPSWDRVQPLTEALRTAPGVAKVGIASQNRSEGFVSVVLELRGTWP
jgi:hypothetical protein